MFLVKGILEPKMTEWGHTVLGYGDVCYDTVHFSSPWDENQGSKSSKRLLIPVNIVTLTPKSKLWV